MPYRIEFAAAAKADLRCLPKRDQVKVLDKIEVHLTHQPTLQSKSRIKRLRQGTFPPYRLRVDEVRVYYDVHEDDQVVIVYGIVRKEKSADWLDSKSESHEKERGP